MFLPKPYQLVLCLNLIKPQLTMLITLKKSNNMGSYSVN